MAPTGGNGGRPPFRTATTLFGRETERAHLDELIDRRDGVVSVTGRGGVGKSALALDVADRRHGGADRVIVVPLASVVDPMAVLEEVAEAAGVRGAGADPFAALVRRLRRRPTLLVLDNAEHVTAAGPEIAALAAAVPSLAVVVTSQRRLGVTGERTLPLQPLATPEAGTTDVHELTASPAVALYLDRAAAVAGPAVPPPDPVDVAERCRRLEGLPLAIELAAARTATIGPTALAAGDDRSVLDLLRQGPTDAPARHRDLRAALSWSYDLLGPTARHLLRTLALVHQPADLDTVAALAPPAPVADVLDDLSELVDLHLVDPAGAETFTVAPSIRAFATGLLTGAEREQAVDRLVAWCTSGAEVPTTALADALRLALDEDRAIAAHRLLVELGPRWAETRVRRDQRALVDRVLSLPAEVVPPPLRARAQVAGLLLAPPLATMADRDHAAAEVAAAFVVARTEGDDDLLLEAALARVMLVSALGEIEAMDDLVAEAAAAAERLGDPVWIARCEQWAGTLALRRLDVGAAVAHGRVALRLARERRDDVMLAHTAMFLAPLLDAAPEPVADVPTLEEALVLVRRVGHVASETWLLPMIVDDLVAADDLARATDLAIDALELVVGGDDSPATVVTLIAGVHLAVALGEDEVAARALGRIGDAATLILQVAPPYRLARHEAAVDRVRAVLGGRVDALLRAGADLLPAEVVDELLAALRRRRSLDDLDRPRLTAREHEVLDLLARGMTNKEIAAALQVRPKTVMHHTSAIYRKLGVRGRGEAVAWLARHGLPAVS